MSMSFLVTMMFLVNSVTKSHAFQHQHEHKACCYGCPQGKWAVSKAILAGDHMETFWQDDK